MPGAVVIPALKANAYGHGALAIAQECQELGATMFAVATVEEFFILRDGGISLPVLILQELFAEEAEAAALAGAVLTIASLKYAKQLSEFASRQKITLTTQINLDTGMGRMGLHSANPLEAIRAIFALGSLNIEGLFSHFSTSDEAGKTFVQTQMASFRTLSRALAEKGISFRYQHMANSGAILDTPDRDPFNGFRPGIALYGLFPSTEVNRTLPLAPVMKVVSRIVKINEYDRPWTVGYGRTYAVNPGSRIAIVPIGYGDGYPRGLSNRGKVGWKGQSLPVAGRVSMDMIAIDLTRTRTPDGQKPQVGDEVILLGGSPKIDGGPTTEDIANLQETIAYEITCGINARVPRIYLREGRMVGVETLREGYRSWGSI